MKKSCPKMKLKYLKDITLLKLVNGIATVTSSPLNASKYQPVPNYVFKCKEKGNLPSEFC